MAVRWGRVLCACTGLVAFVSAFLLGYAFDTLAPTKMALLYDRNIGRLHCDRTYGATREDHGRWYTGLGRGFYEYRFPLTALHVVLHSTAGADGPIIEGKTSDGSSVVAGISFQFQFRRDPASLCGLVQTYGSADAAKSMFISYARSAARDAIGAFAVLDLWRERSAIAQSVKDAVRAAIASHGADMLNLQLLTLDIPDAIQTSIEDTTVQAQKVFQLQLQQQGATVGAITRQLQAEQSAEISIIAASASATASLVTATAEAAALNVTLTSEALGYAALKGRLGLTNEQLLALVYIDTILKAPAGAVTVQSQLPPELTGR